MEDRMNSSLFREFTVLEKCLHKLFIDKQHMNKTNSEHFHDTFECSNAVSKQRICRRKEKKENQNKN